MVRNINEIQKILKEYFKTHPEVEVAYVFGSLSQGKINPLSDIDIALLIDRNKIKEETYPYGYKAEILADLVQLLKTNNVDLVLLDEANPLLRHRILYFGKVIYSRDERKRIKFQIDTINKYNDYKYLFKWHR